MTAPSESAPKTTFLDSLGDRGRRRAEPRASIALAGAGCALAVLGALAVGGDSGYTGDGFNRAPGLILSALIVGAGLATLSAMRQGPIATAGAAATALGIPPFVFFLTVDIEDFPPYSTNAILFVSTGLWLAVYAVGPGRGRPFFLGSGLIGLWFTIMQVTENLFDAPFALFGFAESSSSSFSSTGTAIGGDTPFDPGTFDSSTYQPSPYDSGFGLHAPDPTTLGLICLGLGIAYVLASRWLDHHGRVGAATPFALAALPTLLSSVVFLANDLEQAGTGLFLTAIGAALAYHGATVGRRVTTWVGGAATALGIAVFLADMTDDATVGGMLFMAAGIALVAVAHVLAGALSEQDEMAITNLDMAVAAPGGSAAAQSGGGDDDAMPDEAVWAPPPDDPA